MEYSEFYRNNSGKKVKATMNDGEVFTGELFGYISELDNEPDPESVIIGRVELFTSEIRSIDVLE